MDFIERLGERIELEVSQVFGLGNRLVPTLVFGVTIRNPLPTHLTALSITGDMIIQTVLGPELHIGELKRYITSTPPYPLCVSPNSTTQEHLLVEISWDALETIEKLRAGGELTVKGGLTMLFVETPSTPNEGKTAKRMFWISGELLREHRSSMIIHKKEWLAALSGWGYANKRVLEIDIPSLEMFKSTHEKAFSHLQNAIEKSWAGDYRNVLTECRLCLDNLKTLFDAHIDELGKDGDNTIRKQKIEGLQKAVRGICDIGAHHGQSSTRPEALLCISITRELLAYLGQQRCAHKEQ